MPYDPTGVPAAPIQPPGLPGQNQFSNLTQEGFNSLFRSGPLAGQYQAVVDAANSRGISPALLAAIMAQETGRGTSQMLQNHNNPGGLLRRESNGSYRPLSFDSIQAGIESAARTAANLWGRSGGTLEGLRNRYAPNDPRSDPRNLNRHWVGGVEGFLEHLDPFANPTAAWPTPPNYDTWTDEQWNDQENFSPFGQLSLDEEWFPGRDMQSEEPPASQDYGYGPGIGPALAAALRAQGIPPGGFGGSPPGGTGNWNQLLQNNNPFGHNNYAPPSYTPPGSIDQYAPGPPPLPGGFGIGNPLPLPTFGGPGGGIGTSGDTYAPGLPPGIPQPPPGTGGPFMGMSMARPGDLEGEDGKKMSKDSRGGVVPRTVALANHLAMGGAPVMVKPYVRRAGQKTGGMGGGGFGGGLIKSSVPGRTDKIPMSVHGGSYVLPADVVSGVAENNTLGGGKKLDKLFGQGPYQSGKPPSPTKAPPKFMPQSQQSTKMIRQRFASGGHPKTDIIVAGGEYLLHRETVEKIGGGDLERGFKILDAFVKSVRKKNIDTLKRLPPPKK